ncbi:hypothetical protein, partial [Natranaeroarchaeum aerophilus]
LPSSDGSFRCCLVIHQSREIPIDVVERPSADQVHLDDHGGGDTCRTDIVDCIQGGDMISAYFVNGDGECDDMWGNLTITAGVTQNDETHVMTSAHGFTDSDEGTCGVDISGMPAYQGVTCSEDKDPNLIGHVQDYSHGLDFAIVDTDDYDHSVSSGVVNERLDIDGYVTESGLDYMESNNEDCYKFGTRTCHDSGIVTGIMEGYSRCGEGNTWVEMTTQAANGDSGAPHYREVNRWRDYLQLIGPHVEHTTYLRNGRIPTHDKSYCPAAFQIYDEHGISFDMMSC